jgi:hypothetical protein
MEKQKRLKSHREKKNPGMAEKYAKERHAKNALRGKQRFVGESVEAGGYWTREVKA